MDKSQEFGTKTTPLIALGFYGAKIRCGGGCRTPIRFCDKVGSQIAVARATGGFKENFLGTLSALNTLT
jgi:hypothetical protein